jgi:hypothetical protein
MDESRFGCTMSCDDFMTFWQNRRLRTYIYQQAWLYSHSKEDYEDMRQEAWAAVCLLPPDATSEMARKVAYQAMNTIHKRDTRRARKVNISDFSCP